MALASKTVVATASAYILSLKIQAKTSIAPSLCTTESASPKNGRTSWMINYEIEREVGSIIVIIW